MTIPLVLLPDRHLSSISRGDDDLEYDHKAQSPAASPDEMLWLSILDPLLIKHHKLFDPQMVKLQV